MDIDTYKVFDINPKDCITNDDKSYIGGTGHPGTNKERHYGKANYTGNSQDSGC